MSSAPQERRRPRRYERLSALVLCAALLGAAAARAQAPGSAPEQSIKAAYLYNFGTYVGWPDGILPPGEPFTIGIVDDELVARELEAITRDRRVNGRSVRILRLRAGEPLDGVQMLFVDHDRTGVLSVLADEAYARSVLVVTESDAGLDAGGVINFKLVDQRVRFEVSLDAADASGLTISSRLLAVAEKVLPRSAP